ncbi:hypothetical protein [Paenibacillus sp. OAS669]|uniref:hypothetical protein n=1 Tax=Paenibacillus sp. OAS669 TaxID=2663821 RepID=UPI001789DAA8|nr:hypothetical protein [Paenibacillus sp. OAS669]MBE1441247.1 hypothetical protein [Paenibacillus sp. OAS669]
MPEYSHIQTYVKCNQDSFSQVLRRFSQVLNALNIDSQYFMKELVWELSDNGFMYVGSGAALQEYTINNSILHIRPYVMGWTPEVIKELNESWLEVCLLFYTDEIELDYRTGRLREFSEPIIWNILLEFSRVFTETGVYFTNEVTDGLPWESLVIGIESDLWSFDAAIIPTHLIDKYKEIDKEVFLYEYAVERLYIARKSVWNGKPW